MATSRIDGELKRPAAVVLADVVSILIVEIQALFVLQACHRTVQT